MAKDPVKTKKLLVRVLPLRGHIWKRVRVVARPSGWLGVSWCLALLKRGKTFISTDTQKQGTFPKIDIENSLGVFLGGNGKKNRGRLPDERYASFDYCFNYFQLFKKKNKTSDIASKENLQQSFLHLGFYLASWGMFRASSFLLQKSFRHFSKVIIEISKFDRHIWDIDIDTYSKENIDLLLKAKKVIASALGEENKATDTLTTKIMLGIFGNIPAFDSYFKKHFGSCTSKNLNSIKAFYEENAEVISKYSSNTLTLDFYTGVANEYKVYYTKAKIVDMIGFIEGQVPKISKKITVESSQRNAVKGDKTNQ